jgi:hypothetical protein
MSTSDVDVHNFVLVLSGVTEPDSQLEDGPFEAGCDDAVLAFRNGVGYVEFDRPLCDNVRETGRPVEINVEGGGVKSNDPLSHRNAG